MHHIWAIGDVHAMLSQEVVFRLMCHIFRRVRYGCFDLLAFLGYYCAGSHVIGYTWTLVCCTDLSLNIFILAQKK